MKQKHSDAVQGVPSLKAGQSKLASKSNIYKENTTQPQSIKHNQTQSKEFEGPLQHAEIISISGNHVQSTSLVGSKADSGITLPCPNCPYFSTRRSDLNTHIVAYHIPNPTNEEKFVFEDFIESCELPYFKSPMDQNQVSEIITNQDCQPEITPACDTTTESGNILSTPTDQTQMSGTTSSFFESVTKFMEKPTEGLSIFEQYKNYQSKKYDLEKERKYT